MVQALFFLPEELWLMGTRVCLASGVLWFLDFIQSLPREVKTIWGCKLSGSSALYILNRYLFFVGWTLAVVYTLPGKAGNTSCEVIGYGTFFLQAVTCATTSLLFALRIYVIFSENKSILSICGLFIFTRLGINLFVMSITPNITTAGTVWSLYSRCESNFVDGPILDLANRLNVVEPCLVLGFDTFVFAMTIAKTYGHVKEMRRFRTPSIAQLLLRDGTLYYFVMFSLGCMQAGVSIISNNSNSELSNSTAYFGVFLGPFYNVVPNMLVSRLVLNLRGYRSLKELSSTSTNPTAAETLTSIPELSFAPYANDDRGHSARRPRSLRGHGDGSPRYDYESSRLWGNIGAPLETGFGDDFQEPSVPLKSTGAGSGTELRGTGREGYYEAVAVGSPGPHQSDRGPRGRGPDTVRASSRYFEEDVEAAGGIHMIPLGRDRDRHSNSAQVSSRPL